VLGADGRLDRAALAAIAFADPEALHDLNEIVHPAVGREIARRIAAEQDTDHVVVLDIPLLAENPRDGLAATIVVDVPVDVAVDRLVRLRGMTEEDARSRIARQATREERVARADRVLDNRGSLADLERQVDELWAWLVTL
jgi:dephospho-CoA kinase